MTTTATWRNRIVGHADVAPAVLVPNPRNWRTHPQEQQRALAGALGEVGWVAEVLVNRTTGNVVDGHLRIELALARHESTVPVTYVELTEDEERLVLASLDPLAAMPTAEKDALEALLAGLAPTNEALRTLLAELGEQNGIRRPILGDPDEVPPVPDEAELYVKPAKLWLLGAHRLLCGDATNADDVARLLDDAAPILLATDPPYGVPRPVDGLGRACTYLMPTDRPCRATPLRYEPFCFWHSPETAEEAAEARRVGGLHRRKKKTVGAIYGFHGLRTIEDNQALLETAAVETLAIENSIARNRALAGLAAVGAKLIERRLAKVETALTATQRVLAWLDEAHAFESLSNYVDSLLDQPPEAIPINRLARGASGATRTALRGKPAEMVDGAVRKALRATVFRFELVMRINVVGHEMIDREVLLYTVFVGQLAVPSSDDRKDRRSDPAHLRRMAQCRDFTTQRVVELLAAQEARAIVEARYLDGHAALFPGGTRLWDERLHLAQELAVMADTLAELDGVSPAAPWDPDAVSARAAVLVTDLVEPARVTTLDKLDEGRQALAIATAWLRPKANAPAATDPDGSP